jgi:hypothetical protein
MSLRVFLYVKVPSSPYKRGCEGTCKRIQTFGNLCNLQRESLSLCALTLCLNVLRTLCRVRGIIRIFRVTPNSRNHSSGSPILVCKLANLVLQGFIPTKDIGGNTLFLEERNISVSSKVLPTVKGDNVVYIHSGRPYLGQYHLSSGSLSPAIDDCSLYGRAPGPSSLIHYIFS